jgi:zinc/manganese transport system substrate-binding protein
MATWPSSWPGRMQSSPASSATRTRIRTFSRQALRSHATCRPRQSWSTTVRITTHGWPNCSPPLARPTKIIIVASLVHKKAGDNPHLWYDPATMPAYAKAVAAALVERDPSHRADYDQRLQAFLVSLQPLDAKIADLRGKFTGRPVTATEPVFGYMAMALGLKMRNERFQLAVMNNTEPRASDVAALENDLRKHLVQLLLYNSQASDAAAQRMVRIAQDAKIPVVGVTETEPAGTTFQDWVMGELNAVAQALSNAS